DDRRRPPRRARSLSGRPHRWHLDRPFRVRRRQPARRHRHPPPHRSGAVRRRRGGSGMTTLPLLPTDAPPEAPAHQIPALKTQLMQTTHHDLCPGCGEPVALRILLETIAELGLATSTVAVVGIGCYTAFSGTIDLDLVQALHGRAPSVATGVKRLRPDRTVLTPPGY